MRCQDDSEWSPNLGGSFQIPAFEDPLARNPPHLAVFITKR